MSTAVYPGPARFELYLSQLDVLLKKAAEHKNPALWLYTNNARTPLFMLEGLAKLYAGLHNKKKFGKLKERFKILEDLLGAIDYYDHSAKDLATNKKIPASIIRYLEAQTREKIQQLNEVLTEEKWIAAPTGRTQKIREKLADADWEKAEKEIIAISEFYGEAIYDIYEFFKEKNGQFTHMETDVHEMRRKLRWLSIYPQALQGAIQLVDNEKPPVLLKKYLTKEIVNSPFNKLPFAVKGQPVLQLRKANFLALSWMISELGKIKDVGLETVAIAEALQQATSQEEETALKKAYQLSGSKTPKLPAMLEKAGAVCREFFDAHLLEQLVAGKISQS